MKIFIIPLLIFIAGCSNEKEPEINIPNQRVQNLDRPTGTLQQQKFHGESKFEIFFNTFTDVKQPIMIPLPKYEKDKFDIGSELREIDEQYKMFIPKIADAEFLLDKKDSVETKYFFYQKILINDKLKCPVLFVDAGADKFFVMCSYDSEGNPIDAIIVAGKFGEKELEAEIENERIVVNEGSKSISYKLNPDGKFSKN